MRSEEVTFRFASRIEGPETAVSVSECTTIIGPDGLGHTGLVIGSNNTVSCLL